MSLDTVLKIGNVLRNSEDRLKYFKYIEPCPVNQDNLVCISLLINKDYSIDWSSIKLLPENARHNLFYLKFKTSDRDSSVKYIYGDIFYSRTSSIDNDSSLKVKEGGYYRLPNKGKSSFHRGENDFESLNCKPQSNLFKIRKGLKKDIHILELILSNISAMEYYLMESLNIPFLEFIMDPVAIANSKIKSAFAKLGPKNLKKLKIVNGIKNLSDIERSKMLNYEKGSIFIHFDFYQNKQWYEFQESLEKITSKILKDFVEQDINNQFILKKSLYKTICSGDDKNDRQFPQFDMGSRYKSKSFTENELLDLFYGIDFCSYGRTIAETDLKIIILPKGNNLTAEQYQKFVQNKDEARVRKAENKIDNSKEPIFDFLETSNIDNIVSFDVIFTRMGGVSSPDRDLIEISGINKSNISKIKERLEGISFQITENRLIFFGQKGNFFPFQLEKSFKNILGLPQYNKNKLEIKAGPKYQSHLLKVLPLIFMENYNFDQTLLPSFIQIVEYSIRAGSSMFNLIKFDLEYLYKIQNSKIDTYMEIIKSQSYQAGLLLGSLAKQLQNKINSFEKTFVGTLTRRISSLQDFIQLKNYIEQKLILHDKSKYTFKISYELTQQLKSFDERYDKEECVFGFFESYFEPYSKNEII